MSAWSAADLSAELLNWLAHTDSLTRRMQASCGQGFRVALQAQGWATPWAEESALLGLPPRRYAWVREVYLTCRGVPWVFARSVAPSATVRGPGRRLLRLGSQPLGSILFAQRAVPRGPLEIARLGPAHPLYAPAARALAHAPAYLWGRRSVFLLNGAPLLVIEVFLPEIGA